MAAFPATCAWLLFFGLCAHLCSAADTITGNNSLSGNQTITSSGGKFVLGFFKPGNASGRYYVGIWYANITRTPVWVANRETPVTEPTTSQLQISADGNLVLLNEAKSVVWSTATNITTSNSTIAIILDTGNLQLRDQSDSSRVVWQSFDHPTDTWLPGAKIGLNEVTNYNQRLTAWKNSDDPAPGLFSLEVDPNRTTQYFIFWNDTTHYWSSGTWNGRIFSGVPEMRADYNYDFEYINNATDNYFTYTVKKPEIISRLVMDVSGQIKQLTWLDNVQQWTLFWSQPRQLCQVSSLCGSFGSCNENTLPFCRCVRGFSPRSQSEWDLGDQSSGCTRDTPLQCALSNSPNSDKDKFLALPNVRLPVNSKSLAGVGSDEDCQQACLNNCSCTAYSYGGDDGCTVWYGEELLNLQEQYDGNPRTLQLRLAASELRSSRSNKKMATWIIAGIAAGVLACLGVIWLLIWGCRRLKMLRRAKTVGGTLVTFRYSELQHATRNFSQKLGEGGFGSVFKGSLPDSTAIAVKKLEGQQQGEKQFRTEVSTIGRIQHMNLVRLLGFCSEGTRRLLAYEFMPKGSLDAHLFDTSSESALDWKARYQIALGIARGLAYLHEECRDCIVHCDIKPENILLDDSFVPKVADFGLAKLIGRDFSRVLTTLRGTRGYLAPEWITGVAITAKADVYSYGMMLLEIISGRRNLGQTEGGSCNGFFPTIVAGKLVDGNMLVSLLDPRLRGAADLEELERACKIACWCIQDDEDSRPTMGQGVQVLEGCLEVSMPPIPRSMRVLSEKPENINFFYNFSSNESSGHSKSSDSLGTTAPFGLEARPIYDLTSRN